MKYLIIIPTYNEAENIKKLLPTISDLEIKDLDILIVDDNSPDKTSKIAKEMDDNGILNNNIFVLDRTKKEGLGKAYVAGFKWALKNNYDYIISMDADFSHNPKYLPDLIDKSEKYDVVIGSRYVKGGKITGWNWIRYINSYGANFFTKILLNLKPKDVTAGYKCYSKVFLQSLNLDKIISEGYSFQVEMISLAQEKGFKITETPITFADRIIGESKISGELTRSAKTVFQLASRKKSYRQFIKFCIVGFSGAIIDLGFFNILAVFFGLNIYLARIVSFTLATTNNYILNRKWTFRSRNIAVAKEFSKFLFVSIIGLGLNLLIMRIFSSVFVNLDNDILKKNLPVIIAIVIVLIWNFIFNKYWTFKSNPITKIKPFGNTANSMEEK